MNLMLIILLVSFLIMVLGAVVKFLENNFLTEPLIAMIAGILLGPQVFDLVTTGSPAHQHEVLKIASEFTIAMGLMATALRIPRKFYKKYFLTQTNLIFFGMLLMWLSSSAIFYFSLGTNWIESLLIGAIITPTDPVVAATIITGKKAEKYLPASVRNSLSFEAGANDGLAYPFVLLATFLFNGTFTAQEWFVESILYETILCAALGFAVGYLSGFLLNKAYTLKQMKESSVLPFSLALSLFLLAGLDYLGMNGIIGVFVGGLGFAHHITKNEAIKEKKVQDAMARIFTIPIFFLLGLILPWQEWQEMGWAAVGIVMLVIFLRRIPGLLVMMPILPMFKKRTGDLLIMGWFGPIGVAALYYATLSHESTGLDRVWTIPSLLVFSSTIAHGLSSVPFQELYYRYFKKGRNES
ncbi:MAG: cation:proton antiporter [Salinimicrobium sp.]